MRIGLLKRSLVALLMLALASAWQIAPSFAAEPCQMNAGVTMSNHVQPGGHCKSDNCMPATVCCQAAPNLLAPQNADFSPVDWDRIIYSDASRILVGLRLQPDLHPPTTLA